MDGKVFIIKRPEGLLFMVLVTRFIKYVLTSLKKVPLPYQH